MENCFFKKNYSAVDNDDMAVYGAFEFDVVKTTESQYNTTVKIVINGAAPQPVVKAIGGTFSVGGTSYTEYTPKKSNSRYTIVLDVINEDYKIIVTNGKYYIREFSLTENGQSASKKTLVSLDANMLNFSPYLLSVFGFRDGFGFDGFHGTLELISELMQQIQFKSENVLLLTKGFRVKPSLSSMQTECKMQGVVSDLASSTNMGSLYMMNTEVTGSIESLYTISRTSTVTLRFTGSSKIGGSIDALAAAMVQNGRTTGNVDIYKGGTNITCSVTGDNIRIAFNSSVSGGYTLSALT